MDASIECKNMQILILYCVNLVYFNYSSMPESSNFSVHFTRFTLHFLFNNNKKIIRNLENIILNLHM